MSDELPQGWVSASLAQLTSDPKSDIVSGPFGSNLKSEEYVAEGIPIIRLQNVDRNRFLEKNMRFISALKAEELAAHSFKSGDIVISKLGDPVGKACVIPSSLPAGVVVADVVRVRIDERRFSKRYVVFAINSPAVIGQINQEVKGSTRPRVNLNHLRDLKIPLPPLAEQRRIVAKLEEVLGKVDATRARLAKIPALLKRFRQSVLAAACSGRLTADWRDENRKSADDGETPPDWAPTKLGSLVSLVTSGSRGWAEYYAPSGQMFIRAQNISQDYLDLADIAFVQVPAKAEGARTKVQQHDLLVTITGANVSKTALVAQKLDDAYVSQHVALVRLQEPKLAAFVYLVLLSPTHGRKQLLDAAYGQGKPGLNLQNIRDVEFPLPPLPEQQEIVRRVEALFALADKLEARFQRAQAQVEKLTASVLARAFAGQLVPQNPADEPAAVLLERIRRRAGIAEPGQAGGLRYSEPEPRELKVAETAPSKRGRRRR